ncbi:MAG: hypothetical protein WCP57_10485 [Bacteroidota bacterium]
MKYTLLFVFLFVFVSAFSNNNQAAKKYQKFPHWILMMEDPKVNYFEAQKAFDLFWKNRKKPIEEKEILGTIAEESITDDKALTRRLKKLPESSRNLTFQYKKFMYWSEMIKPYVQEDGSILSEEQIQQINK